jgi:hypothetical protein
MSSACISPLEDRCHFTSNQNRSEETDVLSARKVIATRFNQLAMPDERIVSPTEPIFRQKKTEK